MTPPGRPPQPPCALAQPCIWPTPPEPAVGEDVPVTTMSSAGARAPSEYTSGHAGGSTKAELRSGKSWYKGRCRSHSGNRTRRSFPTGKRPRVSHSRIVQPGMGPNSCPTLSRYSHGSSCSFRPLSLAMAAATSAVTHGNVAACCSPRPGRGIRSVGDPPSRGAEGHDAPVAVPPGAVTVVQRSPWRRPGRRLTRKPAGCSRA
mmetsp:Transcript_112848/g.319193  ORF Transcript_112848/g.319193 Transcript_112848/m.319193 type:complete len:203 (-) Transcript_112848:45-653(-)